MEPIAKYLSQEKVLLKVNNLVREYNLSNKAKEAKEVKRILREIEKK